MSVSWLSPKKSCHLIFNLGSTLHVHHCGEADPPFGRLQLCCRQLRHVHKYLNINNTIIDNSTRGGGRLFLEFLLLPRCRSISEGRSQKRSSLLISQISFCSKGKINWLISITWKPLVFFFWPLNFNRTQWTISGPLVMHSNPGQLSAVWCTVPKIIWISAYKPSLS